MKTVYQRQIGKQEAHDLIKEVIQTVARNDYRADASEDEGHVYSYRPQFPAFGDGTAFYDDDYYSGLTVRHRAATLLVVTGETTSGTLQSVEISREGWITLTHDGARSSSLGRVYDYMPSALCELTSTREGWTLLEYETSQKGWFPVSCFLPNDYQDPRPCTLRDAEGDA